MIRDSIVIFEDDPSYANELKTKLIEHISDGSVDVLVFPVSTEKEQNPNVRFESRIQEDLSSKNAGNLVLIVCDRDLSGTENYRGLSEAAVSKAADALAVPVCLYARGMTGSVEERAQEWRDRQIIMDFRIGTQRLSITIISIFEGFRILRKKSKDYFKKKPEHQTPARVLAFSLSRPEIADRLALYGAGDIANLATVFNAKTYKALVQTRSMSRFLGLWLWCSVMRFPGILINKTAAASYLDLEEMSFENEIVQKEIKVAIYEGPFKETGPYWWRDRIDLMVNGKGFSSGYDMFKKLHPKVRLNEAKCHNDRKSPAGYYCMYYEKPVSERNSKGNLSWFPSGADLARLTTEIYDEIAPWIGLY
ncbi:hypothetical protein ES708_02678 [subsurface metagenome]